MTFQTRLRLHTKGPGLTDITSEVTDLVQRHRPVGPALLTLMIRHTSASLLIQENADPDVRADLQTFLGRLIPRGDHPDMDWLTHVAEGPDDMPAHLRAAILPVSLNIPVKDGELGLGTWQGIFLVEHRDRPMTREILLHLA